MDQLYDVLVVFRKVYPEADLRHWLVHTGGMSLHGFAGIMLAATINVAVAALLHVLLQRGVAARGYKHYVSFMKELHAISRRTNEIAAPVRRLYDTAAVEVEVYQVGGGTFDFTELKGFDDPLVTYAMDHAPQPARCDSPPPPSLKFSLKPDENTTPSGAPLPAPSHAIDSFLPHTPAPCKSLISACGTGSGGNSVSSMTSTLPAVQPTADDSMYLQLLAGRTSDGLLSGEAYVAKRQDQTSGHPLYSNLDDRSDAIGAWNVGVDRTMAELQLPLMESLSGVANFTPTDFMAHFVQIAPAGSVGSDKSKIGWLEDKHNATKRTWINSLTKDQLVDMPKQPACIATNTLMKTEAGKERVLVPGSIEHWAMESVCMTYMEKAIYRSAPEFALETDNWTMFVRAEKRRRRTMRQGVTVASDYADFNFLHTIEDMKKFWRMVAAAAKPLAGEGEWDGVNYAGHVVRCAEWLEKSLDRMYVREPHMNGYYHRVTRGLWSGWRSTSAINNTMNYVYMRVLRGSMEHAGLPNVVLDYELNGDDGDAEVTDEAAGLLYLKTMSWAELDVQPSKQLLSRFQAEFLRIMYRKGHIKGSLARSVASFISSDMQSPKIDVGLSFTKGTSSALSQLIRRGASWKVIESLRTPLLAHTAAMSWTDRDGHHERKLRMLDWLYVPEIEGGFGCSRFGTESLLHARTPAKWPNPRMFWALPGSPNTAIKAMQTFVSQQLTQARISPTIASLVARDAEQIANANVDLALNSRRLEANRLLIADHIEALNHGAIKISDRPEVRPFVQDMVSASMRIAFESDDITLSELSCIDIEQRVAGYIGKNLGVMGISRSVLSMFRDIDTDESLSPVAALMRLSEDNSWYAKLLIDFPETLIQRMINGTINLPRGTNDVLSPLVQPTLVYVQNAVLQHLLPRQDVNYDIVTAVDDTLCEVNRAFMRHYSQRYAELWRE